MPNTPLSPARLLRRSMRGASMLEYSFIVALVGITTLSVVASTGRGVIGMFADTTSVISSSAVGELASVDHESASGSGSGAPEDDFDAPPPPNSTSNLDVIDAGGAGTPQISDFTFGTRHLRWDERIDRVWAAYIDIPGLEGTPVDFTLTTSLGKGDPLAESNVIGGAARSGQVQWGTNLSVDTPEPGETNVTTLTIGGRSATFTVSRDAIPDAGPFRLTSNNGQNFAQISYSSIGIPSTPYAFTISGTGNTNPHVQSLSSGMSTQGETPHWGVNINNQAPPQGETETITMTIDGRVLIWTVTGP